MAPRARIYRHPKTAMQSGMAGTHEWMLDYEPGEAPHADPMMGWSGSTDTRAQLHLKFPTRDEAVAYAEKNGLLFDLELPHYRKMKPKAYADNFKFGRSENWTH